MDSFRPFRFYAWKNHKGEIDFEAGSRKGWVYLAGTTFMGEQQPGEYKNAIEDADLVSVSTFKYSYKTFKDELGFRQVISGRDENHLYSILKCFLIIKKNISLERTLFYKGADHTIFQYQT